MDGYDDRRWNAPEFYTTRIAISEGPSKVIAG